jgi:hypothetical protein
LRGEPSMLLTDGPGGWKGKAAYLNVSLKFGLSMGGRTPLALACRLRS